jgi:hypothetical protein
MEYMGQGLPEADATGAFPAFGRLGADGVQYADSGFLPDGAMPANAGRGPVRTRNLAELSHPAEVSHLADGAGRPDGDWPMYDNRLPDPSQLTEMSSLPGNTWLTDTSNPTDTGDPKDTSGPAGSGEFFPRGGGYPDRGAGYLDQDGWYPDRGAGYANGGEGYANGGAEYPDGEDTSPAVDWYAGYEHYASEPAGQVPEAAGERFLTRVYARPADPRQGPPDGDPERPSLDPEGPSLDPQRPPLEDYPAMSSLIRRLARLRLDRWLIAGGSFAAAVAVIIAFATAATPRSGTAQTGTTHVVQPACVSPATGH